MYRSFFATNLHFMIYFEKIPLKPCIIIVNYAFLHGSNLGRCHSVELCVLVQFPALLWLLVPYFEKYRIAQLQYRSISRSMCLSMFTWTCSTESVFGIGKVSCW